MDILDNKEEKKTNQTMITKSVVFCFFFFVLYFLSIDNLVALSHLNNREQFVLSFKKEKRNELKCFVRCTRTNKFVSALYTNNNNNNAHLHHINHLSTINDAIAYREREATVRKRKRKFFFYFFTCKFSTATTYAAICAVKEKK